MAERDSAGRFKPGQSGNPSGRPQGALSFKRAIERKLGALRGDAERLDHLAETLIGLAESGDVQALRILSDRLWPARSEVDARLSRETTLKIVDLTGAPPAREPRPNPAPEIPRPRPASPNDSEGCLG